MRYRVNFGNGQVHYAGTLTRCREFVKRYGDGWTRIEFQDNETGDWFTMKGGHDK